MNEYPLDEYTKIVKPRRERTEIHEWELNNAVRKTQKSYENKVSSPKEQTKTQEATKKIVKKTDNKTQNRLEKFLKQRLSNKKVIKESKLSIKLPVKKENLLDPTEKDRSRYFKEEWEEEKRSLFFQ